MSRVRVDVDALADWARILDRLPPLSVAEPAPAPVGLPAAVQLRQINVDLLRALAQLVDSLDARTRDLATATAMAATGYSTVDGRAASTMDTHAAR
jgi:hypothetical protein